MGTKLCKNKEKNVSTDRIKHACKKNIVKQFLYLQSQIHRKTITLNPYIMKHSIIFVLISCVLLSFSACDNIKDVTSSQLIFRGTNMFSSIHNNDSVVFSSSNIKSYNATTGELIFSDSSIVSKLKNYLSLTCYQGTDSLFSFRVTSDLMSSIVNDLVLNHNLHDGKYYFEDGYPDWIDNLGANGIRLQNKEKRAVAWAKFITQLKLEGRYKE